MQKITSRRGLTSILTLAAITFLALANSSNPPNGRTGAPGDGLCSDCHGQNNPEPNGSLSIDGFPSSIVPNSTYTLTVTVSNPNGLAERAGFQMVLLNSNDQNAGSLANPSSSSTVTPSGGREYHEHNPAKNFGGGTEVSWTVDWTSPSGPDMEEVTAYAAGIVANGVGGNSGDLLVTTTESGSLSGSALIIEAVSDPVSCFAGADGAVSVNVEGGTPGYTYLWSTGATSQMVTGLEAGIYSVTVTDAQSSTAEDEVEVTEPTELFVDFTLQVPPSCNGDSDGSITAQGSGGTPGYTFTWSQGATGSMVVDLPAGPYSVTITDANGCTAETSTVLDDPEPLVVELVGAIDPSCEGAGDGIIEVIAGGGTLPFTYVWSNGSTGPSVDELSEGTYTVTVSDFNGCTVEDTYVLVAPTGIEITNVTVTDVTCAGGADGSISIQASGNGTLVYSWSTGAMGNTITGLTQGVYTVTVSNETGCAVLASYEVLGADDILLTFGGDNSVSCFSDMDANVTVTADGGTPPYMTSWPDGGDGTGLGAGTYTVTITDANGCTGSGDVTITQPAMLNANASATNETAVDANDGTAKSEPAGGIPPYTFLWSSGGTVDSIGGLAPGDYSVTVTDDNGCTAEQTVTVNTFGCSLAITVETSDVSCFGLNDGFAEVSWTGANGDVAFSWSNGDTTARTEGLTPGGYSVTVTDTTGCVAQANVMIAEPDEVVFELVHDTIVCEDEQVDVMVQPPAFDQYIWSDGQLGQTVTVLPGDYCVTVIDENGCLADTCFTIDVSPPMEVVTDSTYPIDDVGGGYFGISVTGGTPPFFYEWYFDDVLYSTEEDIQVVDEGDYYVIVTDAIGCVAFGDTLFFQAGVGVVNVADQIGLSISPVPATDVLRFGVRNNTAMISELVVFTSSGRHVSSYNIDQRSSGSIDVSTFPTGVYYAAFKTDKGLAVAKFVKI